MSKHTVSYNSQRNNFNFAGKFSGYKQCFSSSSWMFMSFFSSLIKADDDAGLAWYTDQVENSVGEKGIAEKVMAKDKNIPKAGSSFWWSVQEAGINYILDEHRKRDAVSKEGKAVFHFASNWKKFEELLVNGPVIIGTHKMGKLPGGHIVLCIGKDENYFYLNDPFGNPTTDYKDQNGNGVAVPISYFKEACERAVSKGKINFMGFEV